MWSQKHGLLGKHWYLPICWYIPSYEQNKYFTMCSQIKVIFLEMLVFTKLNELNVFFQKRVMGKNKFFQKVISKKRSIDNYQAMAE